MMPVTQQPIAEQSPPAPPRPVTACVSRRAWADPNVRFWWAAGLVLAAIGAYLLITRYLDWRRDARLIESGAEVPATVVEAGELTVRDKKVSGDSPVRLQYEWQGQFHEVRVASLEGRSSGDYIVIGSTIPIRIDPNRPGVWTPRTRPASLPQELIGGLIALSLGILLLAQSALVRSRLLKTWRTGKSELAVVFGARHTALAPRAWSVECTTADDADHRIFAVWLPAHADVRESLPLWLLFPQGKGRPLAVSWFS